MKVIAFLNQKGGSGKTTTALNIGAGIAQAGYKVLMIDSDPQGNLSTSAGLKLDEESITLYEVLKGEASINEAVHNINNNYDLVPTDIRQSGADIELSGVIGRELLIKEAIADLKKEYDYILIDCPPSLSVITLMGLTACTNVIIPVQAQFLALQGMTQLLNTISLVKKRTNQGIKLTGVVLTMYDPRRSLDNTVQDKINAILPGKIFNTVIANNVSLAEAPAYGLDIYTYKNNSKGALQYAELTKELLERLEK